MTSQFQEPLKNADEGELLVEWPGKIMNFFTQNGTKTMSEESVLRAEEEFFEVMGPSLRKYLAITGYYTQDMSTTKKVENMRALLAHYTKELTVENPKDRIITSAIADHATSKWIEMSEIVANPGRIIGGTLGDLVNSMLMRSDMELLPPNNLVKSRLYKLKQAIANRPLNGQILEIVAETAGDYLFHDVTMGRVVTDNFKCRSDLGQEFEWWKRKTLSRFREKATPDLKLSSDIHKVPAYSEAYSPNQVGKSFNNMNSP